MSLSRNALKRIEPRSGTAFEIAAGERLEIVDAWGEQVSDLVCFSASDTSESLSSGRSLDYAGKWLLSEGDTLYSNRSRPLLTIETDTVGRHDFLLTPCSADTFRILYGHKKPHRGCFGNLVEALSPYGIEPDAIPTTFNIFMNVQIDNQTGQMAVRPPLSRAGDRVVVVAHEDLIVGLTACSAEQSNNYSFKPIDFKVHPAITMAQAASF